jgi:hypothetical protein
MIDDNMERYDYRRYNDVPSSRKQEWHDEIDAEDVQHAAHRLPGGSNYREILLKLPKEFSDIESRRMMSLEANLRRGELPESQMQELLALQAKKQNAQEPYYSSHYLTDPNLLAHMRVVDRKGPNGEKILHVEEIQSDWHQEGRKKGYASEDKPIRLTGEAVPLGDKTYGVKWQDGSMDTLGWGKDHAERLAAQGKLTDVVPDAPFKKNWHELAMKRILNYAADNGYDSIAITPGSEQAKRWNNETLKVHYDQKIPQFLNEFGRPYGVEMGQMPFEAGGYKVNRDNFPLPYRVELQNSPDIISRHATPEEAWAEAERLGSIPLHHFKVTPEMRESIKQKGLPLYQQVGIPTVGAGAASQALEPQEEPEYGVGGSVAKMAALAKLQKLKEEMKPRAEAVKNLMAMDKDKYLQDVTPNVLTNPEIEAEIKRMAAKAPMIIKPSGLSELKKVVEQEKGAYGARRLERAADEIPNLERMYQEKALREAFTGDNAKALMTMNPADFEKYAAKLPTLNLGGAEDDYINILRKLPQGFRDVPFLEINKREQGASMLPFISGHEGRHRSRALTSNEEPTSLVRLLPRSELREPFPRRSQEEYIEAMKRELELTGNKVKPEPYTELNSIKVINRPPIDLPDIYAKGGLVKRQVKKADGGAINYNTDPDMSDGGRIMQGAPFKRGGKVNMTTNPDTMFMELSNKKLKRK